MKRFNWLLIGLVVLCLAMLTLLAGCVSKSEYEALQAEYTALVAEKQSLKADHDKLTTEHKALQAEKTTLIKQKESLQTKHDELNTEYEALQAEKTTLIAESKSLKTKYDDLNTKNEAVEKELAEIKKVYPPRYFDNYDELEDWVDEHTPITYSAYNVLKKHLELQEKALSDGYIWSVELSREGKIMSHVVAGDSVYWVWLNGDTEWVGRR